MGELKGIHPLAYNKLVQMCSTLIQVRHGGGFHDLPAHIIGGSLIDVVSGTDPKDIDIMLDGSYYEDSKEAYDRLVEICCNLREQGATVELYHAYPERLETGNFNKLWWGCIKVTDYPDVPWPVDILLARNCMGDTLRHFDCSINAACMQFTPQSLQWVRMHPKLGYKQYDLTVSPERAHKTFSKYLKYLEVQSVQSN